MMLFHTKYSCVVTGTKLNITEQEIVDEKRNFRLLLVPISYVNVIVLLSLTEVGN